MNDNRKRISELHPDVNVFNCEGGLFDVSNSEMEKNIGLRCTFNTQLCAPKDRDMFTIVGIQHDYRGEICYRVVADTDIHRFGCVAKVGDIDIVKEIPQ